MRFPRALLLLPILVAACGHTNDSDPGPADGGADGTSPPPPSDGDAALPPPTPGASVLQFHNHVTRDGVYVDAALTRAAAAKMHADTTFKPAITGHVYAQPLYVDNGPQGKGALYV